MRFLSTRSTSLYLIGLACFCLFGMKKAGAAPQVRVWPSATGFELRWDVGDWEHLVLIESSSDFVTWATVKEIKREDQVVGTLELPSFGEGRYYRLRTNGEWYALSRTLEKSTVLFTQVPDANQLGIDEFGATGVFWGHMPSREIHIQEDMDEWVERVDGLRTLGLDYIGRGEFDWGWAWFIDFEAEPGPHWVQNLDGEYVRYEFMGDLSYKGYRNNWVSHHSPRFLDFMKYQVDRLFEGPVSHVMFDSQTSGTRAVHMFAGDFSQYAMSGFREYMKNRYSEEELAVLGIEDISSFDYGDFLRGRGFSHSTAFRNQMRRITSNIPLYEDFVYFNREVLNEVMDEVFSYVEGKSPGIAIGSTTSLMEPRGFLFSERMTYLAGELFQQANSVLDGAPLRPILHYKAAEAVGKDLVLFPYPGEWAALVNRNATRQARLWIAQAYAMGAVFTIPKNVWTGGEPSVWQAPSELYSDLYLFVRDNEALLDGYRPYSKVGYVYPMLAGMDAWGIDGTNTAHQSLEYLVENNMAFEMLVFGDRDSAFAPDSQRLDDLDVIFVDEDAQYLREDQNALLESVGERLVDYADRDDMQALLSGRIDVFVGGTERNEWISALPRVSDDPEAPYVIHLLNRRFNQSENQVESHSEVSVVISGSMFPETITGALLHGVGRSPQTLSILESGEGDMTLEIGAFDLWDVIELAH